MGESKHGCLSVYAPGNEPFARCFDLLDGFGGSIFKFKLDPANNFNLVVFTGDHEAPQNDMVKVDHWSDDDVGPFGIGELRGIQHSDD
jgi:hypothetical protein